jgi:hypothetical protein
MATSEGLADVAKAEAGGVELDTLFVDEGGGNQRRVSSTGRLRPMLAVIGLVAEGEDRRWMRSCRPSLASMLRTWVSTVCSPIARSLAIGRLL